MTKSYPFFNIKSKLRPNQNVETNFSPEESCDQLFEISVFGNKYQARYPCLKNKSGKILNSYFPKNEVNHNIIIMVR